VSFFRPTNRALECTCVDVLLYVAGRVASMYCGHASKRVLLWRRVHLSKIAWCRSQLPGPSLDGSTVSSVRLSAAGGDLSNLLVQYSTLCSVCVRQGNHTWHARLVGHWRELLRRRLPYTICWRPLPAAEPECPPASVRQVQRVQQLQAASSSHGGPFDAPSSRHRRCDIYCRPASDSLPPPPGFPRSLCRQVLQALVVVGRTNQQAKCKLPDCLRSVWLVPLSPGCW
jgi:hypothetical protein